MNKTFEKNYYLRASDFDKFEHIKPSAVLDFFQDAAGQHAIELGVGFEDMIKRSYLWVLTKIKFKIISTPKKYQKVIVKTWPLKPNRLNYRREYSIENEKGEKLIIGSSEWVIIHSEKRRFVSDPLLYPFSEGFNTEFNFEEKLGKNPDFEANGSAFVVNPSFCDLDINDHVNNTKYANYVLDAINPNENLELKVFQIEYKKEVFQGSTLNIYKISNENTILAKGLNDQGDIMFNCKLEF